MTPHTTCPKAPAGRIADWINKHPLRAGIMIGIIVGTLIGMTSAYIFMRVFLKMGGYAV